MSLISCVGIFFVTWWLCLFVVLPFGVEAQPADEQTSGADLGAPRDPRIAAKIIATTVLAAIVFAGIYVFFGVFHLSVADLIR